MQALTGKHGDRPVMLASPDDGGVVAEKQCFDNNGAGDNGLIL